MLVLSRKESGSIKIGDQIEVKVLSIRGGVARLGIVAPKTVRVFRHEVFEAIQREIAERAERPEAG